MNLNLRRMQNPLPEHVSKTMDENWEKMLNEQQLMQAFRNLRLPLLRSAGGALRRQKRLLGPLHQVGKLLTPHRR